MPKVSVICASYNHEPFVDELVNSVLEQTFPDFELIIVDDCSKDATADRIRQYTDPRLQFHQMPFNAGQFAATNTGIRMAQGEYIAIINSDDAFFPTKLERQVAFLDDNPNVGAVFTYPQLIDEKSQPYYDRKDVNCRVFQQPNRTRYEWLNYFFHHGNALCHPSVLMRKATHDAVGLYEPRFANLADLDLWVRVCLREEIHIIPEPLTKFRVHAKAGNMSGKKPSTKKRSRWEHSHILERFLEISDQETLFKTFPDAKDIPYSETASDPGLIPYFIARLALQKNRPMFDLFAINTLYTLMGNENIVDKLARECRFTYVDLVRLAGDRDPFNLVMNEKLKDMKRHVFGKLLHSIRSPR